MDYQEAWEFLDQLQFFKIKLGLDSMKRFLEELGNPQHGLQYIHVGGTNGKGSVGATLCSVLTAAGYQVGLYTSPHLSSVRERFRIGSRYIGKEDFTRLISTIHAALDGAQITYFECTTALALLWFAEQKVDCAVLEVGMGGRLDATNVITPLISLITNVSMDHEQYLGETLAEVAAEKAGIIKPGVPVISGVTADDDAGHVIRQACDEREAPLFLFAREFNASFSSEKNDCWQYQGLDGRVLAELPMSLRGNYQVVNASLVLTAVQLLRQQGWTVTEEQIRIGLQETFWPGRLEFFRLNKENKPVDEQSPGWNFLLDGAHNPAGVKALKHALRDFSTNRLILVWGAMQDKDLRSTLSEIAPQADIIIFTQAESERSARTAQLKDSLPAAMHQKVVCKETVPAALQQARILAGEHDLICIAGSLYLVGIARQLLSGGLVDDE